MYISKGGSSLASTTANRTEVYSSIRTCCLPAKKWKAPTAGPTSSTSLTWVLMQEGTRGVHVPVAFITTYIPHGYLIWQDCYTVTFGQRPTCHNRVQRGYISRPLEADWLNITSPSPYGSVFVYRLHKGVSLYYYCLSRHWRPRHTMQHFLQLVKQHCCKTSCRKYCIVWHSLNEASRKAVSMNQ